MVSRVFFWMNSELNPVLLPSSSLYCIFFLCAQTFASYSHTTILYIYPGIDKTNTSMKTLLSDCGSVLILSEGHETCGLICKHVQISSVVFSERDLNEWSLLGLFVTLIYSYKSPNTHKLTRASYLLRQPNTWVSQWASKKQNSTLVAFLLWLVLLVTASAVNQVYETSGPQTLGSVEFPPHFSSSLSRKLDTVWSL